MSIFDPLLALHPMRPFPTYKVLGGIFVTLGGLGGVYFLFQALAPLVGYAESGGIGCCLLVGAGIIFLTLDQKSRQKVSLPEEITYKALQSFKDFDLEKSLKNNAIPISLLSLVVGIALSQMKHVKELAEIYKLSK